VKVTVTCCAPAARSSWSISGMWRWRPTPYGVTFSSADTKCVVSLAVRPAPDTPLLASTTTSAIWGASGASASSVAVG
jgi:hypothetical protein